MGLNDPPVSGAMNTIRTKSVRPTRNARLRGVRRKDDADSADRERTSVPAASMRTPSAGVTPIASLVEPRSAEEEIDPNKILRLRPASKPPTT